MKTSFVLTSALLLNLALAGVAFAQETAPESAPVDTGMAVEAEDTSDSSVSLNLDLEASSAYVWRGGTVFGANQGDQDLAVFPSISATFSGVTVGYWGAYQVTGENTEENVDNALGAEQDLFVGWDGAIGDDVSYSVYATYYFYPFADTDELSHFIEPALGFGYSTAVDLGLGVSYFRGIDDASDEALSHVYINPGIGREISLTDDLALALDAGFGYKVWTNDIEQGNGDIDVGLNASVAIPLGNMYIVPAVHGAWSNFDEGTQVNVWGGVNFGYDVAL